MTTVAAPAAPAVAPLRLGDLVVDTPVVLAPMAGVTNTAYRQLCAEQGAGLYVCEMVTSRGLVEGDATSRSMVTFAPNETVRSVQLYGVDPATIAAAVTILCDEFGVHHVDLNFGCPVPKVTRKGGGAALPWKRTLLAAILEQAVAAATPYGVPVTMKTRIGIDDEHETFLDAGRIAAEAGCAAIALHGRTAVQSYSGVANWDAIAALVDAIDIPVLGNGDIWEAEDALAMMARTGCAGVVIGRGCLGRPWLFADLAAAMAGSDERRRPNLGEVAAMFRRHSELLAEHLGPERGLREIRKHVAWYFKGFGVGGELRGRLARVATLDEVDGLLAELDASEPFPLDQLGLPRGRQGSPKDRVVVPEGWLDDTDGCGVDLSAAEIGVSGG